MKLNKLTLSNGLYRRYFQSQYLHNSETFELMYLGKLKKGIALGVMEYIMGCNQLKMTIEDGPVTLEIPPDCGSGEFTVIFNNDNKTIMFVNNN